MKTKNLFATVKTIYEKDPPKIKSSSDAIKFLLQKIRHLASEKLFVMTLNEQLDVLSLDESTSGTAKVCLVDYAMILKPAILTGATRIIVLHNHPTNSPDVSKEDVIQLRAIAITTSLFDIQLDDFIILTREQYHSLAKEEVFKDAITDAKLFIKSRVENRDRLKKLDNIKS